MESSGKLFKNQLDKAFSQPGIKMNSSVMGDAMKYKQSFKETEDEDKKEKKYLDIEDMIPMLKKQLMKGTKVDQQQKKEKTKSKEESKEATGSGSSGAYSEPLFGGEMKEKWSEEYKNSIDCKNPKGFSQKAHCQSKSKKKETKEATSSGSTGAFTAPVGFKDSEFVRRSFKETPKLKESDVEKIEATEATGTGSTGGYESPAMWAKSTKKKDWGPSRKTQIPGGGFVKINKKCTKFPYCNQGEISNIKISNNESVKEAIKRVSKRIGVSESTIITILEHEYEKANKRTK
jgi:hypothetical protein